MVKLLQIRRAVWETGYWSEGSREIVIYFSVWRKGLMKDNTAIYRDTRGAKLNYRVGKIDPRKYHVKDRYAGRTECGKHTRVKEMKGKLVMLLQRILSTLLSLLYPVSRHLFQLLPVVVHLFISACLLPFHHSPCSASLFLSHSCFLVACYAFLHSVHCTCPISP